MDWIYNDTFINWKKLENRNEKENQPLTTSLYKMLTLLIFKNKILQIN